MFIKDFGFVAGAVSFVFMFAGCNSGTSQKMVTTPSGLKYMDITVGTGKVAEAGKRVSVHYDGWLKSTYPNGKKFDSSRDRASRLDLISELGKL